MICRGCHHIPHGRDDCEVPNGCACQHRMPPGKRDDLMEIWDALDTSLGTEPHHLPHTDRENRPQQPDA